jgi:hypothetical protein
MLPTGGGGVPITQMSATGGAQLDTSTNASAIDGGGVTEEGEGEGAAELQNFTDAASEWKALYVDDPFGKAFGDAPPPTPGEQQVRILSPVHYSSIPKRGVKAFWGRKSPLSAARSASQNGIPASLGWGRAYFPSLRRCKYISHLRTSRKTKKGNPLPTDDSSPHARGCGQRVVMAAHWAARRTLTGRPDGTPKSCTLAAGSSRGVAALFGGRLCCSARGR